MNGINEIAERLFQENMTTFPSDEPHVCPHCQKVIPRLNLVVLGQEKSVQPRCKCEVDHVLGGIEEAAELKRKREIESKFSVAKLGERFARSTFENFIGREGSERALKFAKSYADAFPSHGAHAPLIWGSVGNGKSHLAAAICHEIKERGFIPVFQSVPELLERIRSTFRGKNGESEKEIMDALRECDLLVLDDIGAEKVSDWVLDVMFRIIDGRYRQCRPIVFTTNFTFTELLYRFMPANPGPEDEVMAKRIHDRIAEMSVPVKNEADSYRIVTAGERVKKLTEEEKKKRGWSE